MRLFVGIAAAALIASPAAAQQAKPDAGAIPPVPKELTDPATADKLARMMQALSKSFLELPVGELEAIAEGREPTAADRRKTVGESARAGDPDFERAFQQQMANARPMIESSMKALAAALPAMMKAMEPMAKELEKATANLPSPNYPKQ